MREVDGKTVAVIDRTFKQRRDYLIEDQKLQGQTSGDCATAHRAGAAQDLLLEGHADGEILRRL